MHAFRCKNCGHLHAAEHAGENEKPHACAVCGAGVSFHPRTGLKQLEPDNWEVLADAAPERLDELGIAKEHVVKHAPAVVTTPRVGVSVAANVTDGVEAKQ